MVPDESSVTVDRFGVPVINVTSENLKNFPALISWIRRHGYGRDTGLLKLRLCPADRRDTDSVKEITKLMKRVFKEKEWDDESKEFKFKYNPSVQIAHKVSADSHVYQYSKVECNAEERKAFVEQSVKPLSYRKNSNCCSPHVASGDLDHLRHHIFTNLANCSPNLHGDLGTSAVSMPVYGDGIVLDEKTEISICDGFTLSSGLDQILCHLDKKYDGIACPYYYSAAKHSLFPWHVEDGGLFSINYLFKGAPKFWFGISPTYFGLMDKIGSGLHVDLAHTSCRAFLVDHKVLVADPDYFKQLCQVPYAQVLQEEGDFIITLPFGLHAGFNTGKNLAVAANFADLPWIEVGMYAPICSCNELQVQLDLSGIIKECRPDLLDIYHSGASLIFPQTHPREIRYPPANVQSAFTDGNDSGEIDDPAPVEGKQKRVRGKYFKNTPRIKDRTLFCSECKQSFTGNKLDRLKLHIKTKHPAKWSKLFKNVQITYPSWTPKMTKGKVCNICNTFIRGDKGNLKTHMASKHREY